MNQVTSDLLAKGLTKETQVLRVPLRLAILNAGIFSVLLLVCVIFSLPFVSFVVVLLCLPVSHLLLMILTIKDDRAISLYLVDKANCYKNPLITSKTDLIEYQPLENQDNNRAKESISNLLSVLLKKEKVKDDALSRHIPYEYLVNQETVSLKRGGIVQVVKVSGINAHTLSGDDLDELKDLRNRFLYQINHVGLTIHSYLIKERDTSFPGGVFHHDFVAKMNQRYQKTLEDKNLYQHHLYLVFVLKATDDQALKTLNEITEKALSQLNHFRAHKLSTKEDLSSDLLSFLAKIINQGSYQVKAPRQSLNTFLPFKRISFSKHHGIVVFDGASEKQYGALLYIKEYPEDTMAGMLDTLLSLDCEFILNQSFQFLSKRKAVKALKDQQKFMSQGDESVSLTSQITLNLDDLQAGRLSYGMHALKLLVKAKTIDALQKKINLIESKLNEDASIVCVKEFNGIDISYWSMLPGNEHYSVRDALISTQNFASLTSLHNLPQGKINGNHWGHALTTLETVYQTRFHFSVHVKEVGNSILIGPMGSGKTAVLSKILADMNKFSGWRFVFDKDRGMEIIIRAMGGHYSVFRPGQYSDMAPLQLDDTKENRAFNVLLLKKLLSTKRNLSAHDEKVIERAVKGIYELEKKDRTYSNLAPFFGVDEPDSLRESFNRWCGSGNNAWVFDNKTDAFSISNQLTGLDIGNLLKDEYLEVSTPVLMYVFHRIGALLDGSPTAAFIPEGWRMLSDDYFQKQLHDWSKTPRKNNMAVIMDTQSPVELAQSEAGCSVAKESVTQIFFGNARAEWNDYKLFNLTEREFHIIRDELPVIGGHFFLLKQGGHSLIVRADLSNLEQDIAILSSNLVKATLLDAIREQTGDRFEDWIRPYLYFETLLRQRYANDIKKLKKDFDSLWEDCP